MKKIILILFFLLFSIISFEPNIATATSGACSYHGGVNCSAGSSIYGKVICNDGWTNSSVYFSDVEECKKEDICPKYIDDKLYQSFQKDQQTELDNVKAQYKSACVDSDRSFSGSLDYFDSWLDSYKSWNETCLNWIGLINSIERDMRCYIPKSSLCKSLDPYSYYDGEKTFSCQCSYGMDSSSGKCISEDIFRSSLCSKDGDTAIYKNGKCLCSKEYKLSNDASRCIFMELKGVPERIYNLAKNGSCPFSSQEDIAICNQYLLQKNNYNWIVIANDDVVKSATSSELKITEKPFSVKLNSQKPGEKSKQDKIQSLATSTISTATSTFKIPNTIPKEEKSLFSLIIQKLFRFLRIQR